MDLAKKSLTCLGAVILGLATTIGGCVGGCEYLNNYEYSHGARTGMVNKMSKKGLIWKTYEGQMALEGITSSGSYAGANVWDFSLDRQARHGENIDELARSLNDALDSGEKVKVKYIEIIKPWPWRGSTGYFIQDVQAMKKDNKVEKEN